MKKLCLAIMVVLCACVILNGCSFSRSSAASSRSSGASSRSSSPGGEGAQAPVTSYHEEIASLAVLYAGSGGTTADFQRDISIVAGRYGISYWETDSGTFIAIGQGLRRADVSKEYLAHLPFLQGLRNKPFYSNIFTGYDN